MSKKQLSPEQIAAKAENKALRAKRNFKNFLILLEIAVICIGIFSILAITTISSDMSKTEYVNSGNTNAVAVNTAPQQNTGENNVSTATPTDTSVTQDAAFKTPEEMVEYFNNCANKVKTDATEVVKNFEKRQVGELVVPDILQSIAETLIKDNMKDDTDPIVYGTKEEIRENFLVPAQDYVSCLTTDAVEEISYEETETEYVFHIKLKDEKDPRAGSGVGSVCDVIETHEVTEKAPAFLQEFSTNYYDCEVTATIDKETGRMVHAVYTTPLTLNVVANLFGTHSASVGFTFIKDYTITY